MVIPKDILIIFKNYPMKFLKKTEWNYQLVGRIDDEWKIPDYFIKIINENFIDLGIYNMLKI